MRAFWGKLLGRLLYYLLPDRRRVARQNIDQAFSNQWTSEKKDQLVKDSFEHFATLPFDFIVSSRWDLESYESHVKIDEASLANFKKSCASYQGLILMSAHLGNWELAARWFAQQEPGRLHVVVKDLSPRWLNRWVTKRRRALGSQIIRKQEAARGVLKALKSGDTVCVLMDQNRYDGVFVPFFGRLAGTSPLIPTLALRTGSGVLPVCCYKIGPNEFQILIEEPLKFEALDDRQAEIKKATLLCNEVIEKMIKRHPQQWLWAHRRYKSLAPDQLPFYNDQS